jgi:hypothetical protein
MLAAPEKNAMFINHPKSPNAYSLTALLSLTSGSSTWRSAIKLMQSSDPATARRAPQMSPLGRAGAPSIRASVFID